jgi:hypothetical protein
VKTRAKKISSIVSDARYANGSRAKLVGGNVRAAVFPNFIPADAALFGTRLKLAENVQDVHINGVGRFVCHAIKTRFTRIGIQNRTIDLCNNWRS